MRRGKKGDPLRHVNARVGRWERPGIAAERHRSSERGQVLVLFALLLPLFLTLGSIVVSVGNWYVHKRHLQMQVDSAAFAAGTQFTGCFADGAAANTAIRAGALGYAGDRNRDATTTNLQVQESADVHVVLNSERYWEDGDPVDDPTLSATLDNSIVVPGDLMPPPSDPSDPCETRFLDVKGTDHDVPDVWPWLPFSPDAKAKARVEIHKVKAISGMLPFAVPEIEPGAVAAIFVDENAPGGSEILNALEISQTPPPPSSPLAKFNVYDGLVGGISVSSRDDIGVIVLVANQHTPNPNLGGTSLAAICTQSGVRCYSGAGQQSGLAMIHGYSSGAAPAVREVHLSGCADIVNGENLSAPYFSLVGDCAVVVSAQIDFGGAVNPQARLHTSPSCGGSSEALTSSDGVTWIGGTTLPDPSAATGPFHLSISWKTGGGGGGFTCFAGGPVARPYVANAKAGPVEYLALTATNGLGTPVPNAYSISKEPTAQPYTFMVTVGLRPPLRQSTLNDEAVLIRFASEDDPSLTQSIDCDIDSYSYPEPYGSMPGGKDAAEIAHGCVTPYAVSETLDCSEYGNGDLPPDPSPALEDATDCAQSKNGQVSSLRHGLAARFESPCTPNNWPDPPITPEKIDALFEDFGTDPRLVTLIVTEWGAFAGTGSTIVPIKYFAGFYVTGWDVSNTTAGCYGPGLQTGSPWNDPHPIHGSSYLTKQNKQHLDDGDVWGYFVTPVIPAPAGTSSEELCAFDELGTCIAVLVE
jgi:hypothetical protein